MQFLRPEKETKKVKMFSFSKLLTSRKDLHCNSKKNNSVTFKPYLNELLYKQQLGSFKLTSLLQFVIVYLGLNIILFSLGDIYVEF